jgi:hypothetical protein
MAKIEERRSLDRHVFPQASGSILRTTGLNLFDNEFSLSIFEKLSKKIIIKDINKSGACIQSEEPLKGGDIINLIISIPGERKILVKGYIKWITFVHDNSYACMGTQFLAYGDGKKYNSSGSLERLRKFTSHPVDMIE